MKTGKKISIIYSVLTISLVVMVAMVSYFVFSHYTESVYFRYLEEKAHAVAAERFEKDELTPKQFARVVEMRKAAIPTSEQYFINTADTIKARSFLLKYLSVKQLQRVYRGYDVDFNHGDELGTAFLCYDNEGVFVVMVLSRNPYVATISSAFRWLLVAMVIIAAFVLWLISRLYAMRMVDRIDKAYHTERMFVNNASHEINNPLTAIQGECEIALMKERSGEDYRKSLKIIEKETTRIVKIMKELLLFSHASSDKTRISELDEVHVSEILGQMKRDGVTMTVNSEFVVLARQDLLTIALRNIVNNAVKYAGGKGVEITVNSTSVVIRDHGIGIKEEDLDHIFEPFFRASNTQGIVGHGIGLSLAKEILQKYGLKITVNSKVNEGSTFRITK